MLHAGTAPKPLTGVTVTSSALLPSGPAGTMLVLQVPACTYWVGLSPLVGPSRWERVNPRRARAAGREKHHGPF